MDDFEAKLIDSLEDPKVIKNRHGVKLIRNGEHPRIIHELGIPAISEELIALEGELGVSFPTGLFRLYSLYSYMSLFKTGSGVVTIYCPPIRRLEMVSSYSGGGPSERFKFYMKKSGLYKDQYYLLGYAGYGNYISDSISGNLYIDMMDGRVYLTKGLENMSTYSSWNSIEDFMEEEVLRRIRFHDNNGIVIRDDDRIISMTEDATIDDPYNEIMTRSAKIENLDAQYNVPIPEELVWYIENEAPEETLTYNDNEEGISLYSYKKLGFWQPAYSYNPNIQGEREVLEGWKDSWMIIAESHPGSIYLLDLSVQGPICPVWFWDSGTLISSREGIPLAHPVASSIANFLALLKALNDYTSGNSSNEVYLHFVSLTESKDEISCAWWRDMGFDHDNGGDTKSTYS